MSEHPQEVQDKAVRVVDALLQVFDGTLDESDPMEWRATDDWSGNESWRAVKEALRDYLKAL